MIMRSYSADPPGYDTSIEPGLVDINGPPHPLPAKKSWAKPAGYLAAAFIVWKALAGR